MFNFSIPTTRPTSFTLQKVRSFFRVFGVRVIDVFAVGNKLQVLQPVIASVQVFVVDFKAAWNRAVKRLPNRAMHADMLVLPVDAWRKMGVKMAVQPCFNWPRGGIAAPRFSMFNGEHGCDAGVQKRGYVGQSGSRFQHFLGFNNLFGGKTFAACYTTNIAKIANFVQSLVSKYWPPKFHLFTLSTYRYYMPVNIKGQA